jgi:uncharacterized protein YndB with AHSA1/START domain/DNA-binding transcriptional ArsR family regulator
MICDVMVTYMRDPLAAVFKALADPTRRRLLDLLAEGPRTTGDLCGRFRTSRFAVMKHLGVLERAGLVTVRRHGRERWNHLNPVPLRAVQERWLSPLADRWAGGLWGLKRRAEERAGPGARGSVAGTKGVRAMEKPPVVDLKTVNLRLEIAIAAPPKRVFAALTDHIGHWWGAPYLRDKDRAVDFVLEPRPGGRVVEVWGDGEGAVWAEVTRIRPPEVLEITGRIGMTGPAYSVVSFELAARGKGTVVTLTHQAIGDVDEETEADYREGWEDLLGNRLKPYVEAGTRSGART